MRQAPASGSDVVNRQGPRWRWHSYSRTIRPRPSSACLTVSMTTWGRSTCTKDTGIGAAAVDRGTEVGVRVDLRHAPEGLAVALAEQAARTPGVRLDGVSGYHAPATTPDIRDIDSSARRHAERVVAVAAAIGAAAISASLRRMQNSLPSGSASTTLASDTSCR